MLSCRELDRDDCGQIAQIAALKAHIFNGDITTMKVILDAERASEPGHPEWFTGTVWLDEIAVGTPPAPLRVHAVTFEPGARTAWHAHPLGQVLHVLSGIGRVQQAGEPVRELRSGDTVLIASGERHWHGAAPDRIFVHLAVQEATASGDEATWYEHVREEGYRTAPRPAGDGT
jgi:quercetin dioxygenase-like cupin family protein